MYGSNTFTVSPIKHCCLCVGYILLIFPSRLTKGPLSCQRKRETDWETVARKIDNDTLSLSLSLSFSSKL